MNQQLAPTALSHRSTLLLLPALALLGTLLATSPAQAQSPATMSQTSAPPRLRALPNQPTKLSLQQALILVDGQEMASAELEQVAPEKIKSIDVLKGDEALAKYGGRGRSGVVQVTTKK